MSLYNGDKLKIEIYGQSHAEKIGVRVSGFPRMKIDEERDIKVKFPEEYFSKELSGKDAIFKIKLQFLFS